MRDLGFHTQLLPTRQGCKNSRLPVDQPGTLRSLAEWVMFPELTAAFSKDETWWTPGLGLVGDRVSSHCIPTYLSVTLWTPGVAGWEKCWTELRAERRKDWAGECDSRGRAVSTERCPPSPFLQECSSFSSSPVGRVGSWTLCEIFRHVIRINHH